VLLNAEAVRLKGWEFFPAVAVALPVEGRLNVPRMVPAPFTSNVVVGVVVLMPIRAVAPLPD
jgi:hypothetical protein